MKIFADLESCGMRIVKTAVGKEEKKTEDECAGSS